MKLKIDLKREPTPEKEPRPVAVMPRWLPAAAWVIAVAMLLVTAAAIYHYVTGVSVIDLVKSSSPSEPEQQTASLPAYQADKNYSSLNRASNPSTVLPVGSRKEPIEYSVQLGDSIFGISKQFSVEPESVLWANYETLNDDPHLISVGVDLKIPPTDGVLHLWREGDTLEKIAGEYHVDVEDILLFPGNDLDITNPVIAPGTLVMVPGGYREFRTWVVPVVAGNNSGVTAKIAGPGSCTPAAGGYVGTYSFVWPTQHYDVSGNDYWGGHQGLDIMCLLGEPIFAADSGVVIYSGTISGGYGNLVAIDHQNGYLTLYAHLNSLSLSCGQSVTRGQAVGTCGSTGNSTGAHLHFEVRQNGGFINPRYVLP